MIFYLHGDQLYPTQAAAPKGYTQVDVPVSKAELMAYINNLLKPKSILEGGLVPTAEDIGWAKAIANFPPDRDEVAPTPAHRPHFGEPVCPSCARTKAGAEAFAKHIDLTTIYDLIDRVPQFHSNIKDYVNER